MQAKHFQATNEYVNENNIINYCGQLQDIHTKNFAWKNSCKQSYWYNIHAKQTKITSVKTLKGHSLAQSLNCDIW